MIAGCAATKFAVIGLTQGLAVERFLAADESSFITGESVLVDGGLVRF